MPTFIKTRQRINGDTVITYPDGRVVVYRGNQKVYSGNRNG